MTEAEMTIAALRAEVADLLPMLDADAMTISTQQAEIDRLRSGITAAVEGRYERPPDVLINGTKSSLYCLHGHRFENDCARCLRAHFRALLDPQTPGGR